MIWRRSFRGGRPKSRARPRCSKRQTDSTGIRRKTTLLSVGQRPVVWRGRRPRTCLEAPPCRPRLGLGTLAFGAGRGHRAAWIDTGVVVRRRPGALPFRGLLCRCPFARSGRLVRPDVPSTSGAAGRRCRRPGCRCPLCSPYPPFPAAVRTVHGFPVRVVGQGRLVVRKRNEQHVRSRGDVRAQQRVITLRSVARRRLRGRVPGRFRHRQPRQRCRTASARRLPLHTRRRDRPRRLAHSGRPLRPRPAFRLSDLPPPPITVAACERIAGCPAATAGDRPAPGADASRVRAHRPLDRARSSADDPGAS